MSCRDDNAVLVRHECARDRNHSRNFGVGSMCTHGVPEQASTRQMDYLPHTAFMKKPLKSFTGNRI